jgi:hypothetical protein
MVQSIVPRGQCGAQLRLASFSCQKRVLRRELSQERLAVKMTRDASFNAGRLGGP